MGEYEALRAGAGQRSMWSKHTPHTPTSESVIAWQAIKSAHRRVMGRVPNIPDTHDLPLPVTQPDNADGQL